MTAERPRRAASAGVYFRSARARGALLVEVMLALAIFVVGGLAVIALVDRSIAGLGAARDAEHAALLARSAMARIESGIALPQAMNGPVRAWDADDAEGGSEIGKDRSGGWELEVGTEPAVIQGLTLVRVTAFKRRAATDDRKVASYTLSQFVRLSRVRVSHGTVDDGGVGR